MITLSGPDASVTAHNAFDRTGDGSLPATGADGARWVGAGLLALLLVGAGVTVTLRSRRRG